MKQAIKASKKVDPAGESWSMPDMDWNMSDVEWKLPDINWELPKWEPDDLKWETIGQSKKKQRPRACS